MPIDRLSPFPTNDIPPRNPRPAPSALPLRKPDLVTPAIRLIPGWDTRLSDAQRHTARTAMALAVVNLGGHALPHLLAAHGLHIAGIVARWDAAAQVLVIPDQPNCPRRA